MTSQQRITQAVLLILMGVVALIAGLIIGALIAGLTGLAVAGSIALASPANAAQGGNDKSGTADNHHSWMKVSAAELRGKTVDQACREALRGDGRACDHLVVAVTSAKMSNPNADGYRAEWYYNRAPYTGPGWGDNMRSGTW